MSNYEPVRGAGLYDLVDGVDLLGHRFDLSTLVDGSFYCAGGVRVAVSGGLTSGDDAAARKIKVNPWLEAHTSFSMVACGAFALACIAGVMYLIQEQQLKTRQSKLDLFPAAADNGVIGSKFSSVMAGFRAVHGRAHHGISDWPTDRLDAGGLVYRRLVCLRRYPICPSSARRGGQVGCDPVDRRI